MSAFEMSPESLAKIANTVESVAIGGFNNYGFEVPERFKRIAYEENGAKKLYMRLYEMNVAAVNQCYGGKCDDLTAPDMPRVSYIIERHREYRNGHEVVKPWHYHFLKLLDCYLYQCTEGDVPAQPLYKALAELQHVLQCFIIAHNDIYNDLPWGE